MIYFIQDEATNFIKIGLSENVEARLRALQVGSSSALVLLGTATGDERIEHELHKQFATARVRGEWFRPVPALIRLLMERAAEHQLPYPRTPEEVAFSKAARAYSAGRMSAGAGCVLSMLNVARLAQKYAPDHPLTQCAAEWLTIAATEILAIRRELAKLAEAAGWTAAEWGKVSDLRALQHLGPWLSNYIELVQQEFGRSDEELQQRGW